MERSTSRFRPQIEPFEPRRLPSDIFATAGHLASRHHSAVAADHRTIGIEAAPRPDPTGDRTLAAASLRARPMSVTGAHAAPIRLTLSRITQTSAGNAVHLIPPFQQVLVQRRLPVPGRTYNVLSVLVRNHTSRTFTAADGFSVRLTGQPDSTPVLTGDQQWKPGQWMVFYVLTHRYYPVHPVVSGGFEFDLGGSRGVAIPGPSGIFLRLPYRPSTFARTLDWIVAYGPGAEGGPGASAGLPDTQIWEFRFAAGTRSPKRVG